MPSAADASVSATRRDESDDALDRALVERSQSGEREAFSELYRRHVRGVHAFAYRSSGSKDIADEVTSATFERALRSLHTFTWKGGGIHPWLLRIAATETSAWYRREQKASKPRAQMILRELAERSADQEDEPTRDVDPMAMRAALGTLHPSYQEAISLRYFAACSLDEIATAMGCSKATLSVTLHRAVSALRRSLAATSNEVLP